MILKFFRENISTTILNEANISTECKNRNKGRNKAFLRNPLVKHPSKQRGKPGMVTHASITALERPREEESAIGIGCRVRCSLRKQT